MIFGPLDKRDFYLAFDLGTASVSAALFSMDSRMGPKAQLRIEEIYRSGFDVSQGLSPHDLLRRTLQGMREITERSSKKINMRPRGILVGLSAPFYLSRTVKLRLDRPNAQTRVTEKEAMDLVRQAELEVAASLHIPASEPVRFFNRTLVEAHVNGYPIKNPIGSMGKRIEVLVRLEAVSTSFELQLTQTIHHLGVAIPTRIASAPYAQTRALGLVLPMTGDRMLVDIGSEVTELSLIRDGVLGKVISLPHGSGALVRAVAEALAVSFQDALFLLRRLSEAALEGAAAARMNALVKKYITTWRGLVSGELKVCRQDGFAPTQIFITGGGSLLLQYKDSFSDPDFTTLPLRGLGINVLQPTSFQDFFENVSSLGGPEDFTLICLMLIAQIDPQTHGADAYA